MSRKLALALVCMGIVGSAGGCGGDGGSREPVASFALEHHTQSRDVDVLFVIANRVMMEPVQDGLALDFGSFVDVLENLDGGMPDLHLGIVTTDVDSGNYEWPSRCVGARDNGALQSAANGDCTPPDGAFISDVDDGAGGRTTNYTGTLQESFECIARLGSLGCDWPQPLEAMKRALDGSNPGNDGFLRADALLSVVLVTRVDDCSASDTGLFDPSQTTLDDPLGPPTLTRCFEFGVKCDPEFARTAGTYENCVPRDDSAYEYSVDHYVSFLAGLKDDSGMITVATISGDPSPVVVYEDQDLPWLEPSCQSEFVQAGPSIRLAGFADAFPGHGVRASVCQDLSDDLTAVAQQIGQALEPGDLSFTHCLDRAPADTDGETAGLQADCEASLIAADQSETALAACDRPDDPSASTNLPCFVLHETALCGASDVMIETFHAAAPAAGASIAVSCRVD